MMCPESPRLRRHRDGTVRSVYVAGLLWLGAWSAVWAGGYGCGNPESSQADASFAETADGRTKAVDAASVSDAVDTLDALDGATGPDAGGTCSPSCEASLCQSCAGALCLDPCQSGDGCCGDSCDGTDDDCDAALDVPVRATGKRTLVVAQDGTGDYATVALAVAVGLPGDSILVKDGVYVGRVTLARAGTREEPIFLGPYPGHAPVIKLTNAARPGTSDQVRITASWWIVEGFEIVNGWDGIKVYADHVTIRRNRIHHHAHQGILAVGNGQMLIEDNRISWSGRPLQSAAGDGGGRCEGIGSGSSPRHCHGIYLSGAVGTKDAVGVVVRRNVLSNHAGRAILVNYQGKDIFARGWRIENNLIVDSSWGVGLNYNVAGMRIVNNTMVMRSYPETNDVVHYFIGVSGSSSISDVVVANNIFYTTRGDVWACQFNTGTGPGVTMDWNMWSVLSANWKWNGSVRSDFQAAYTSVTCWGAHDLCCGVDPGFVSSDDFHLRSGSVARDAGGSAFCAAGDFDQTTRAVDGLCDMGMDEIGGAP